MYVFEENGRPLDDRAILRDVIRPAATELGFYFEGLGWHSFRRQNITVLQEVGATTFEVMAQAGHSRPAMTPEYTMLVWSGAKKRSGGCKRDCFLAEPGRHESDFGDCAGFAGLEKISEGR